MSESPDVQNFIGGAWTPAVGGDLFELVDPDSSKHLAHAPRSREADVDRAVEAARLASAGWRRISPVDRGRILARISHGVLARIDELTEIESADTGKPVAQARADIQACARYFEYYAGAVDKVGGVTIPTQSEQTAYTLREPHGVTAHVIAWNAPAQMFGRTLAPALAMANAAVLKPAEAACLSIPRLAQIARDAGLPDGVLNVVFGLGTEAGQALIDHPGVDHVSFTGSPEVGSRVQAASAKFNRPVSVELGGKSPQIVFADADLDEVVPAVVGGLLLNTGQTCSAGSRLLVERPILDELVARLATAFRAAKVGRYDSGADCGPVISANQAERVRGYLNEAQSQGIPTVAQADIPEGREGFYVAPSILGPLEANHRVAQEEIFGPVLVVVAFDDETEAIEVANGTPYGLVAGVWTANGGRQFRLARALECGQVFINNYGAGGGVEFPFGGVKRSGFGREKGFDALLEYSTVKTVIVRHGASA